MEALIAQGEISRRIYRIRGVEVMLDRDLAELYGVETRVLKQAVKRNLRRFPDDFMFVLTEQELDNVVSQSVIPSRQYFGGALPYGFTEQGVYMVAALLRSDFAIDVSIEIMRTFVKLRQFASHYNALAKKILEVEHKSDKQYHELTQAIQELIEEANAAPMRQIGFVK